MLRQRHRTYASDSVGADDSSAVRRLMHSPCLAAPPCTIHGRCLLQPLAAAGCSSLRSMDLESTANLAFGLSAFDIFELSSSSSCIPSWPFAHLSSPAVLSVVECQAVVTTSQATRHSGSVLFIVIIHGRRTFQASTSCPSGLECLQKAQTTA